MALDSQKTTFNFNATLVGSLKSIGEVGGTADEIDVTTLDSADGYKEFMPSFKDSGEIALSGFFDDAEHKPIIDEFGGEAKPCIITFPDGATLAFTGWIKAFKVGAFEVGQPIGFSATVRITGPVVYESEA